MGPTWGQSGADSTQVGPMLAPWTLLSGQFVSAITDHLFKLGSPNLDQQCKGPWLRPILYCGVIAYSKLEVRKLTPFWVLSCRHSPPVYDRISKFAPTNKTIRCRPTMGFCLTKYTLMWCQLCLFRVSEVRLIGAQDTGDELILSQAVTLNQDHLITTDIFVVSSQN